MIKIAHNRYSYIGNPFGYKIPDPKPIIHPIVYNCDDFLDIQKKEIEVIKRIILSIIGECKLSLFGSMVKGYWDNDSDYDLVIHKNITSEQLSQLRSQRYPRKVDINFTNTDFVLVLGKNILLN